ncbi:kinase-like domain-containing protein [Ephemerocybe angulata]|uniref:Kinase-like domain-containing protein n=1 Tax=Ephemerocybe angulata TaxID=980116 RepID=A0A8H6M6X6_9AGAR|nr:kinase-like domain-containing protein [Tulosesus angulatus]
MGEAKIPAEDYFAILKHQEAYWRDKYEWLLKLGYQLRPRYRPDWIPSWKLNPNLYIFSCEDSITQHGKLCDALRISDGSQVMLKTVDMTKYISEVPLMEYLNEEPQKPNPTNHTVPLLDVLDPPDEPFRRIIVMPVCRMWDSPDFDTVGEVVDCIKQLIEGVQFLHTNRIAHRDLAYGNFMMDPSLFTIPFHPFMDSERLDFKGSAKAKYTRTQHRPRYYIIDYGLSARYEENEMPPSEVMGAYGSDRTVPEHASPDEPHNPFPIDIYCLGNLIRREILQAKPEQVGFGWIVPLIMDMMSPDPARRPTIDEVALRYEECVSVLKPALLRSRWSRRWTKAIPHLARKLRFIITQTPPIPT